MKQHRTAIDRVLRVAAMGLVVVTGSPARADVVHGFATLTATDNSCCTVTMGIDFSTQLVFPIDASNRQFADLQPSIPVGPGGGCYVRLVAQNGTRGRSVTGTTLEALTTAPEPPYCCIPEPELDETCVLLTADGLYVKYAVRWFESDEGPAPCLAGDVKIEYYVQTDGTRDFGPLLPVNSSTWGSVKALYR